LLSFGTGGGVDFQNLASQLAINGATYTLVGDISTLAADVAANSSGNFALANNYDASKDGTYQGSPIPTWYSGSFDGLGNTIANLAIGNTQHVGREPTGLFSIVTTGSVSHLDISDINLDVRHIEGQVGVGALAGDNGGTIQGVRVSGTVVSGANIVGGVVGSNGGTINGVISTVGVTGEAKYSSTGGLVGENTGLISNSYGAGNVFAHKRYASAGGLVGNNEAGGEVSNSQATGKVTGNYASGGLIGFFGAGTINETFATGAINGAGSRSETGGLVGWQGANGTATINESYSTGAVSGNGGIGTVGGMIGIGGPGAVTTCYWDTTTSGTDNGVGGGNISGLTGLTSKQLRSGLPAGFDPAVWAEERKINNGFPYLIADPPLK